MSYDLASQPYRSPRIVFELGVEICIMLLIGLTTEYRATFHIVLPSQWLVGSSVVKDIHEPVARRLVSRLTSRRATLFIYLPSLTSRLATEPIFLYNLCVLPRSIKSHWRAAEPAFKVALHSVVAKWNTLSPRLTSQIMTSFSAGQAAYCVMCLLDLKGLPFTNKPFDFELHTIPKHAEASYRKYDLFTILFWTVHVQVLITRPFVRVRAQNQR